MENHNTIAQPFGGKPIIASRIRHVNVPIEMVFYVLREKMERPFRFFLYLMDITEHADPPHPVKLIGFFPVFRFVFHDSPADADPLKLEKR
jgi:hypothetical protein